MDPQTLRQSLRFGGSTRFGVRTGLGRYGMGLPNASLSQARRIVVYTWQDGPVRKASNRNRVQATRRPCIYRSYLDVDEIVAGEMKEIPEPTLVDREDLSTASRSGSLVIWERCDRLDHRRVSTIARKLHAELARRFRHFIWRGLHIDINGEKVLPFDPLFVNQRAHVSGAMPFGEPLIYEVCAQPATPSVTGRVEVRFSELPVEAWYNLSNEEKRRRGIIKGRGSPSFVPDEKWTSAGSSWVPSIERTTTIGGGARSSSIRRSTRPSESRTPSNRYDPKHTYLKRSRPT